MSSSINQMYGKRRTPITQIDNKNPNRVAGGLRGQGVDHFVMLGEDGMEKSIPTHKYVQSLEDQIRSQKALIEGLEKRVVRLNRLQEELTRTVSLINSRRT